MTKLLRPVDAPASWARRQTGPKAILLLLLLAIAGFFAVQAVRTLTAGGHLQAALFSLFAVMAAALEAALVTVFWHSKFGRASGVTIRTTSSGSTTVLKTSQGRWYVCLFTLTTAVAFGWWGVLRLQNRVPWTDPASIARQPWFGFVLIALAAVSAAMTVELVLGLFRREDQAAGIALSAWGVQHRALETTILPWDAITSVTASGDERNNAAFPVMEIAYTPTVPGVLRKNSSLIRQLTGVGSASDLARRTTLALRPDGYAVGAPHVLAVLQYYLQHPERRDELGTDASVRRTIEGRWTDVAS